MAVAYGTTVGATRRQERLTSLPGRVVLSRHRSAFVVGDPCLLQEQVGRVHAKHKDAAFTRALDMQS